MRYNQILNYSSEASAKFLRRMANKTKFNAKTKWGVRARKLKNKKAALPITLAARKQLLELIQREGPYQFSAPDVVTNSFARMMRIFQTERRHNRRRRK